MDHGHPFSLKPPASFEQQLEILKSRGLIIEDDDLATRPIWVAIEVLSFGALSKLFSNMKIEDRNCIAKTNYRVPAIYLESWLKCLSYVRNICAHYGRLYNRPLTSKPRLDHKSKELGIQQNRIFAHIYIVKQLIPDCKKWRNFTTRLEALLSEYENVLELDRIGFPEDWEALLIKRR